MPTSGTEIFESIIGAAMRQTSRFCGRVLIGRARDCAKGKRGRGACIRGVFILVHLYILLQITIVVTAAPTARRNPTKTKNAHSKIVVNLTYSKLNNCRKTS
jgi:hypothetical protein